MLLNRAKPKLKSVSLYKPGAPLLKTWIKIEIRVKTAGASSHLLDAASLEFKQASATFAFISSLLHIFCPQSSQRDLLVWTWTSGARFQMCVLCLCCGSLDGCDDRCGLRLEAPSITEVVVVKKTCGQRQHLPFSSCKPRKSSHVWGNCFSQFHSGSSNLNRAKLLRGIYTWTSETDIYIDETL